MEMAKPTKRYARGFTLVELLVVIAIIGLLASMLFPVLARAKEQGRQTKCLANLSQLAKAAKMYSADWNDRFPPRARIDASGQIVATWQDYLSNYIREPEIYVCPSAKIEDPKTQFSYAWNHNLSGMPEAAVYQETRTFAFYDSADFGTLAPWDTGDPPYDNYEGCCDDGWYDIIKTDEGQTEVWGYMDTRHNDHAMVVYVDGHTGTIMDLWTPETKLKWELDQR
jgi:prepilin-type N-terminal cleavage/methylation domain-containing protein/prepilin-type processing-associated H-X9-DG protein